MNEMTKNPPIRKRDRGLSRTRPVEAGTTALLVIDVFLFVLSYVLVFVSAVALRRREPVLTRSFRIPLGTSGLSVMIAVPIAVAILFALANGAQALLWGALAAATGPLVYALVRR